LELRRDWIDLREVVERITSAARRRGSEQPIEVSIQPNLPLVRADATLIEQAIGNIIGNAIVHTPKETRITVDALVDPETVSLRVTDTGPGIDAGSLPHIFDKFVKAPTFFGDGGEGVGLGLAITKGIMDAHGGSIRAESPVAHGHGSRFVLTFAREVALS
jgi:two-component system sensor histidine kinase KdpD